MNEDADLSAAYGRVMSLPMIDIADADRLARDFGLQITGPDGDDLVWAEIADPAMGVSSSQLMGSANSPEAKMWLAWRGRRRAH